FNCWSPNPSSRLFSSGTQSKHQPKFSTERSRSQTSFIHCPPHGAGSKKGTTRNGRRAVPRSASRNVAPLIIFGSPGIVVSGRKGGGGGCSFFLRSGRRQPA